MIRLRVHLLRRWLDSWLCFMLSLHCGQMVCRLSRSSSRSSAPVKPAPVAVAVVGRLTVGAALSECAVAFISADSARRAVRLSSASSAMRSASCSLRCSASATSLRLFIVISHSSAKCLHNATREKYCVVVRYAASMHKLLFAYFLSCLRGSRQPQFSSGHVIILLGQELDT